MAGSRRAAAARPAPHPEARDEREPQEATQPEPESEAERTLQAGDLVVLESLTFAGRIFEPGEILPPTFPADVAEIRIADGSVARA